MIYVIGDLHFGIRGNSKLFHTILLTELNRVLSKITRKDSVVLLGDIFDSRSSANFNILNDAWDFFITLSRKSKEVFILAGNHDLYYKENRIENVNFRFLRFDPNSDSSIAPVHIINDITESKIDGKDCLFIPWIDSLENKKRSIDVMNMKKYDIIFGHFDLVGLYGTSVVDDIAFGDDVFPDDTMILSGHFHRRTERGKVLYVGSVINSTFNDVGNVKGIHVIKKNSVVFLEGTSPKFEYITVDNPSIFVKAISVADQATKDKLRERIQGNIIKLILNEYAKENESIFKFIKDMNPLELTVGYNRVDLKDELGEEEFSGFDAKTDINVIISSYVDKIKNKLPSEVESDDIKRLVSKKHQEFKTLQLDL